MRFFVIPIIFLLTLTACNKNNKEYYSLGDSWQIKINDTAYKIEYIDVQKDCFTLTFQKESGDCSDLGFYQLEGINSLKCDDKFINNDVNYGGIFPLYYYVIYDVPQTFTLTFFLRDEFVGETYDIAMNISSLINVNSTYEWSEMEGISILLK